MADAGPLSVVSELLGDKGESMHAPDALTGRALSYFAACICLAASRRCLRYVLLAGNAQLLQHRLQRQSGAAGDQSKDGQR